MNTPEQRKTKRIPVNRRRALRNRGRGRTARPKSPPGKIFWAITGLLLTIWGTLIEASATNLPWQWAENGLTVYPLGVFCQIAGGLFAACMGGKSAGFLSQGIYVLLGVLGLPIFTQGGGLSYIQSPTFGYLIGFIPGAWICGYLAFRYKPNLEYLALSCLAGLTTIHFIGIVYLMGLELFSSQGGGFMALWEGIFKYTIDPFPGQLAIVCGVSLLAFILRLILFY